ncbi:MAG: DinB family protein, partial [Chloroflexota bacterium]|nr:DinB family protein [Chloroflexota bacterium]
SYTQECEVAQRTLEKLAQQREQLLAVVRDLSEGELERPVDERWTVRDTLTHLLNAEEDHCRVIALAVRGDTDRLPPSIDLDGHNNERLAERGRLERNELLGALVAQRERTETLFQRLDQEQLEMPLRHPALGETTVGKVFRIIALHEKMHLKEIEAAL